MKELIFSVVLFLLGGVAIFAACTGARWFFSTKNAAFFVRTFGLKGARWFYFILGAALCLTAYTVAFSH